VSDRPASEPAAAWPARWGGLPAIILALALGTVGGAIFLYWRLPLAWMMGAMVVTTVAALVGVPMKGPMRLRSLMVAVLGVMLGSAFTPETLGQAAKWTVSLGGVLLYSALVAGVIFLALRRRPGFGPVTAYFSGTPGGLSEMILFGGSFGGDERTISLIHSMRILIVVMVIPFWFRFAHGYEPSGTTVLGSVADIGLVDALILAACCVGGYIAARRLNIPAAALSGPMIASAAVHVGGVTAAVPPSELVAIAQVVMGTTIGCRFAGHSVRKVFATLGTGVVTTVFMLAAGLAFAIALERLTGLPFPALLLAFSPGGLAEMGLICLSMGIDIAFVSTHHLIRIFFIVVLAPFIFRAFKDSLTADVDQR
jgi:membrane AbrB-like protein